MNAMVILRHDAYGNPEWVSSAPPGQAPGIASQITTSHRVFPSGRTDWYGNGATGEVAYTMYDAYGRATESPLILTPALLKRRGGSCRHPILRPRPQMRGLRKRHQMKIRFSALVDDAAGK